MYELTTKRTLPSFITLKDSKVLVKAAKADLNSKAELEIRIEFILETIDPDQGNVLKSVSLELYILVQDYEIFKPSSSAGQKQAEIKSTKKQELKVLSASFSEAG